MEKVIAIREYKRCGQCREWKLPEEFHVDRSKPDGRYSTCKVCACARKRERHATDPVAWTPERQVSKREATMALRNRNRAFVREYLAEHPCVDCGESDPIVLEFDHVRGEKSFNVSYGVIKNYSLKRLAEEIAKCDIRCANCHRRVTATRGGFWYATLDGPEAA
jgi:hypothetical protein